MATSLRGVKRAEFRFAVAEYRYHNHGKWCSTCSDAESPEDLCRRGERAWFRMMEVEDAIEKLVKVVV